MTGLVSLVRTSPIKVKTAEMWDHNLEYQSQPTLNIEEAHYEEYSQKISDIQTYGEEWVVKVISGELELTEQTFADYKAQLKAMGMEECIAWQQAALTAYNNLDITVGYTAEQVEAFNIGNN